MQSLTNGIQPIAACAPWGYSIREAARVSASASSHADSQGTLNDKLFAPPGRAVAAWALTHRMNIPICVRHCHSLDMMDVDGWSSVEEQFAAIESTLLDDVLSKEIVRNGRYESLIMEEDGDAYRPVHFVPSRMENFCLYVVTTLRYPDPELCERLLPIEVMPSGVC